MPYKKVTLLLMIIIMLVSLTFGHKLYGYVQQVFDQVLSAYKVNNPTTFISQTDNIKSNSHPKENQLPKSANNQKRTFPQPKATQKSLCPRPPLKEITTKTQTYVKEDGSVDYKEIKQYYFLNTNLGNNADVFLNELNLKLYATFERIENQLGISLNYAITLNLIFHSTRTGYENKVRELGGSPEGTQGMYIYPNNVSIISVQNYEQGIKTAIHEAIHAFNKAYWGSSLRFFNEGMAEYFESITAEGLIPPFNFSRLTHQQYPKQISTLLFSEIDWHSDNTHELYQNSKALFHFLMSHERGRQVVRKIMELEKEDPCTILSNDNIEILLIELFLNHQQEFDYWFANGLNHFVNNEKS